MRLRNQHGNLALFCGQLALSLMQTAFMFYYVKVFLNVFHVNEYWFNVAQVLFMIWNAINDPLFGYIQVNRIKAVSTTKTPRNFLGRQWYVDEGPLEDLHLRRTVHGGLVSFAVVPMAQLSDIASVRGRLASNCRSIPLRRILQVVAQSGYSAHAAFSCVGVAWGALFTESTRDHRRRVNALKYSQLAILLSVNVIVIAEKTSHSLDVCSRAPGKHRLRFQNFQAFQILCVVIALLSFVCFYATGQLSQTNVSEEKLLHEEASESTAPGGRISRILSLTRELLTAKDFQRIVIANFIHSCRYDA